MSPTKPVAQWSFMRPVRLPLILGVTFCLLCVGVAQAQLSRNSLTDPAMAQRLGLTRMWHTQVEVDPSVGQIAHISQHINSSAVTTLWQVVHDDKVIEFSEDDFDAFGRRVGPMGASHRAAREIREIITAIRVAGAEGVDAEALKATDQAADQVITNLELEQDKQKATREPVIVDVATAVAPLLTRASSTPEGVPKLVRLVLPRLELHIATTQGVVHCINGETGETRWTTEVGHPDHPTLAPAANDLYVAVVNGSSLFVLENETGKLVWSRRLEGVPGASPAMNEEKVFIPLTSRGMEAYSMHDVLTIQRRDEADNEDDRNSKKYKPRFIVAQRYMSGGRSAGRAVATADSVCWPTDLNYLYVASGRETRPRFKMFAQGPIVAACSYLPPHRLLMSSIDGYVYCMHELSGDLLWRFSSGIPISQTPVPIGGGVFVVVDDGGMFRISPDTGEEEWWSPGIRSFVAASESRLYCTDRFGNLVILDMETGARIATSPAEDLEIKQLNLKTDRLIVGTKSGFLMCLRENQLTKPLIHEAYQMEEEDPAAKKKPKPTTGRAADDPFGAGGGGGADPFGGGGGADPFGGGGGADPFGGAGGGDASDPFGGGGKMSDDPFGGGGAGADPFGGGGGAAGGDPFGGGAKMSDDPFGG